MESTSTSTNTHALHQNHQVYFAKSLSSHEKALNSTIPMLHCHLSSSFHLVYCTSTLKLPWIKYIQTTQCLKCIPLLGPNFFTKEQTHNFHKLPNSEKGLEPLCFCFGGAGFDGSFTLLGLPRSSFQTSL
jgi:hypothetical protein